MQVRAGGRIPRASQPRQRGAVSVRWLLLVAVIAVAVVILITLMVRGPQAGLADYRRWPGDVLEWVKTHLFSVAVASLVVAIASPFLEAWLTRRRNPEGAGDQRRRAQDRARMLARVRHRWIDGVLNHSLAQEARLVLGLERAPDALHQRALTLQRAGASEQLPPGTTITQVFDRVGGRLLILGRPGSGKTTALLELARDLLQRVDPASTQPIPVVVNLSSWPRRRLPLAAWLVEELVDGYDVPRPIARAWVRDREVLPLLDGLDEVAEELRGDCVAAINDFQRHHLVELVVCSRSEEYRALTVRLRVEEAVALQPPTRAQVTAYLESLGVDAADGGAALGADEELWELLQSPLMLSIVALTYSGRPVAALLERGSVQERRDRLFAAYTEQMFARRPLSGGYGDRQGIRWLAWLARSMHLRSQSEFHLDRLQPDWLSMRARQQLVTFGSALVVGLGVGGTLLLLIGLGFLGGLEVVPPPAALAGEYFPTGGFRAGLVYALVYGSVAALMAALAPGAIQPVEEVRWSWAELRRGGWKQLLLVVVAVGLVVGLLMGISGLSSLLAYGPAYGAITGLVVGLVGILFLGLVPGLVEDRVVPNEGIRRSVRHGVIGGLLAWLVVAALGELLGEYSDAMGYVAIGLAIGWTAGLSDQATGIRRLVDGIVIAGLLGGVVGGFLALLSLYSDFGRSFAPLAAIFVGVIAWLHFGGRAALRHLLLRLLLALERAAPWRFVHFLDDATHRLFLRRSGSAHLFVHRLLLEYFADMEAEHPRPGKAAQPPTPRNDP
jgi:eukaryotic-like serine/threonine-protein kinase